MPELRKDPILGRWVIISVERGKRPTDYGSQVSKRKGGFCSFCIGNEYTTPKEIIAFRPDGSKPNTTGWTLRVVPNKFPALQIEGDLDKIGDGIYDKMNGIGAHEVIIETPSHDLTLSSMSLKAVEDVIWAYYYRIEDLKNDPRFRYVLVFKNEGEAAGASLEHSHSQLIALPVIPREVKAELDGARHYYDYKERCIFCDMIRQEIESKIRVISEEDNFIAISPFAPRAPFETWILPKKHSSAINPKDNFPELSVILQRTLRQLDKTLDTPPYNMMLHTSPFGDEDNEYFHWHMEIMPKLTKIAGFEWGSGFYINPTPPEEATKFMKGAKI